LRHQNANHLPALTIGVHMLVNKRSTGGSKRGGMAYKVPSAPSFAGPQTDSTIRIFCCNQKTKTGIYYILLLLINSRSNVRVGVRDYAALCLFMKSYERCHHDHSVFAFAPKIRVLPVSGSCSINKGILNFNCLVLLLGST